MFTYSFLEEVALYERAELAKWTRKGHFINSKQYAKGKVTKEGVSKEANFVNAVIGHCEL